MDVCVGPRKMAVTIKRKLTRKRKKDEKINHEEFERQRKRCQINKWQGPAGSIATLLYLEEEDGTTTHAQRLCHNLFPRKTVGGEMP
jgi:hypothetical protein